MKSTVELEMRHLPQQLIQWHSSIGKNKRPIRPLPAEDSVYCR
jgi:hypothetical protein